MSLAHGYNLVWKPVPQVLKLFSMLNSGETKIYTTHKCFWRFMSRIIAGFGDLHSKFEPLHGKTNNLHRRKQRRRSASR